MDTAKNIETIESQIQKLQNELQFNKSYQFLQYIANNELCQLPEHLQKYYEGKTEVQIFSESQLYDWMNFNKPSVYELVKSSISHCHTRDYKPKWSAKAKWHAKFIDEYMNSKKPE